MSTYWPDTWKILSLNTSSGDTIYKIFAGWYGGFSQGDSWKLSSAMFDLKDEGDFYSSLQESGSTYNLHKNAEKLSSYQMSILSMWEDQLQQNGAEIKIVHSEDYLKGVT